MASRIFLRSFDQYRGIEIRGWRVYKRRLLAIVQLVYRLDSLEAAVYGFSSSFSARHRHGERQAVLLTEPTSVRRFGVRVRWCDEVKFGIRGGLMDVSKLRWVAMDMSMVCGYNVIPSGESSGSRLEVVI